MSGFRMPTFRESIDPNKGIPASYKVVKGMMSPKAAAAPDMPPPPVLDDTAARAQDEADRIRRRNGRASAMLTGGNAGVPMTASRTLLGA